MERDFLGTGWAFPVRTDHRGAIALSNGEANIEESVRIILGTAIGERVMRPEFGCAVHDYVFSSVDPATLNLIEDAVTEALIRWEPRIDIESVDATPDATRPSIIHVEIEYWVRATNARSNMVYPFYTTEGEG